MGFLPNKKPRMFVRCAGSLLWSRYRSTGAGGGGKTVLRHGDALIHCVDFK